MITYRFIFHLYTSAIHNIQLHLARWHAKVMFNDYEHNLGIFDEDIKLQKGDNILKFSEKNVFK